MHVQDIILSQSPTFNFLYGKREGTLLNIIIVTNFHKIDSGTVGDIKKITLILTISWQS